MIKIYSESNKRLSNFSHQSFNSDTQVQTEHLFRPWGLGRGMGAGGLGGWTGCSFRRLFRSSLRGIFSTVFYIGNCPLQVRCPKTYTYWPSLYWLLQYESHIFWSFFVLLHKVETNCKKKREKEKVYLLSTKHLQCATPLVTNMATSKKYITSPSIKVAPSFFL